MFTRDRNFKPGHEKRISNVRFQISNPAATSPRAPQRPKNTNARQTFHGGRLNESLYFDSEYNSASRIVA
jgi:hypothetical protein